MIVFIVYLRDKHEIIYIILTCFLFYPEAVLDKYYGKISIIGEYLCEVSSLYLNKFELNLMKLYITK